MVWPVITQDQIWELVAFGEKCRAIENGKCGRKEYLKKTIVEQLKIWLISDCICGSWS